MTMFMTTPVPRVATAVKKDYWDALWKGFLVLIAVPILAFIIAFTIVGLPVTLVLMLSYALLLIIAQIVASLTIGSYFVKLNSKNKKSHFSALAIGAAVYVLLVLIPFIGSGLKFIILLLALGSIWRDSYTSVKAGKY